jgi:choline dehydrogenase-like flavoprotein
MATRLKAVDVVTVGAGLTGTILAKELADAGLKVVGLERGGWRDTQPDFAMPYAHDELRYARRHELMQDLSRETLTFRNGTNDLALPMRYMGSFLPGEGVGGAAVHWNGVTWRFLPWDFETRSRTLARYGAAQLAEDCTSQDWGVSYDELEPHFDRFEYLYGICGKAGNLKGKIVDGGNPFEGPRAREYPNPPMKTSHVGAIYGKAAKDLGYHPFPAPSANMTRPYTNTYGVTLGACVYCGYCERFGCEMGAKASPQTTVLPVLMKSPNYEPHARERDQGQSRLRQEARGLGDLRRLARPRVRAARRPDSAHVLRVLQRAPDAALRDRQALRPAGERRGRRAQLRLPDERQRQRFLRGQGVQPVHGRWRAVDDDRRSGRRQLRSLGAGLHRGRLDRRGERGRSSDRLQPGAAGHAALGRRVEEGRGALLQPRFRHHHARSLPELPRQLSRPRPDLPRRLRAAVCA